MRTHNKFGNHEKIHSNTLAPCRLRFGAGPRGISAQRRMAFLLQVGEQQRQRPARNPAPHMEYRHGSLRLFPRNDSQLSERHVRTRRMGIETVVREVLRRAERRRPLRERLSCRRTPRRVHGLHLRNHRQDTLRRGQCAAGRGEQQQPRRRAPRFDRHESLRRHLPRSGADPDRKDGRFTAPPRFGGRTRAPEFGHQRAGRRRGGDISHLGGRKHLHADARHHGPGRTQSLHQTAENPSRRQTRRHPLLDRRSAVVEPLLSGALPGNGQHRRRDRNGQRDGTHGFPEHSGNHGGRPYDQRRAHSGSWRDALPRQRHFWRRITTPTCSRSAIWEPTPCVRPSCPTRSISTTAATSRACWSG